MFKILDQTKDNLIAFKVQEKISPADYEKINVLLDKTKKEHEKIKLFVDVSDIKGIEIRTLWDDFETYLRHVGKIRKVAVVGKGGWDKILTKVSSPLIRGKVKFFTREQYESAMTWISEE